MTYAFNPHRHVKIWLSKDRNTFLNLENRVRLVKMRDINPTDDIHFVYDSGLLSEAALADLRSFCTRYNIVPKDVRTDLFPNCRTVEETNLISIYNDEMSHLQQGGNVAVGSDILRWLKPVYELGTYTDFDVHVDTSKLSPTMTVLRPLLMRLGSNVLLGKAEAVSINNDTISVVDCEAALPDIKKIQRALHESCSRQESNRESFLQRYLRIFQEELESFLPFLAPFMPLQHPNKQALDELANLSRGKTANQVREDIILAHSTNALYARKYLSEAQVPVPTYCSGPVGALDALHIRLAAAHRREQFKPLIGWRGWLLLPKTTYKQLKALCLMQNDNALLEKCRSTSRMMALKNSVVYSSGPGLLAFALFDDVIFGKDSIDAQVAPFAYMSYGLDKAYISTNCSIPFHTSAKKAVALLSNAEIGKSNDISWLQEGQDATVIREQMIRDVQLQLPQDFHNMREKIDAHIKKIRADLQGCLGFYRHRERHAKISALQQILSFFDERQFNVEGFKAAVGFYRTRDVSASMGKSKTKQLIDELERFGQQAKHLMLTDVDGRVALPASKTTITSEDTGSTTSGVIKEEYQHYLSDERHLTQPLIT